MDADKLFEGIGLLIELAERGEIDPWDVQVIDVIDRYLSKLISASDVMQAASDADLSQSGQAFLSASMLVLFKANTLTALESPADCGSSEDDFLLEADGAPAKLRLPLEHQLRRRSAHVPPQKRRVTLQELIEQLHLMATQLQSQTNAPPKTTHISRRRTETARATLELAHQENLTEVAGELEQFLNLYSHRSPDRQHDWLNLDQLVELLSEAKRSAPMASSPKHGNKDEYEQVSVFWALLLLSAQSKVELFQEEFYQEIKIRKLEEVSGG